jgi:hypothetical protein
MTTAPWVIVYDGGSADTGLLRDLLEAAGIPVQLRDEVMGTVAPYLIEGGAIAAIKVLVPEDRGEEARAIVTEFTERSTNPPKPGAPAFQPWECPCCHEQNDGTFDICWNCQSERATDRS